MDFEKQTPVTVQSFHYDLVDEGVAAKSEVNPGIRKLDVSGDDEHSEEERLYNKCGVRGDTADFAGRAAQFIKSFKLRIIMEMAQILAMPIGNY